MRSEDLCRSPGETSLPTFSVASPGASSARQSPSARPRRRRPTPHRGLRLGRHRTSAPSRRAGASCAPPTAEAWTRWSWRTRGTPSRTPSRRDPRPPRVGRCRQAHPPGGNPRASSWRNPARQTRDTRVAGRLYPRARPGSRVRRGVRERRADLSEGSETTFQTRRKNREIRHVYPRAFSFDTKFLFAFSSRRVIRALRVVPRAHRMPPK